MYIYVCIYMCVYIYIYTHRLQPKSATKIFSYIFSLSDLVIFWVTNTITIMKWGPYIPITAKIRTKSDSPPPPHVRLCFELASHWDCKWRTGKIQGRDGRIFLDRFKSYFGSQIIITIIKWGQYLPITAEIRNKRSVVDFLKYFRLCSFQLASRIAMANEAKSC